MADISSDSAELAGVVSTPFGSVEIISRGDGVERLRLVAHPAKSAILKSTTPVESVYASLVAYIQHRQWTPFDGTLDGLGLTRYQRQIYVGLNQISFGQTMTYGALARELKTGPRALAGALRRNPLPILMPCHRVLAASGIGGFMGSTSGDALVIKRWLINHEKRAE